MTYHHIFLSALLTLSFSSNNAMHTTWENDPHAQKKINVVRALDNIFSYIYEHNLTLANANSELQKKSADFKKHYSLTYDKIIAAPIKPTLKQDYVDEYTLRFKIASLKQGILICIALPQDVQRVMLSHLGFASKLVQDDFLNRPLPQAFEWLTQCHNKPFTESPARYLLNYEQYYCMEAIASENKSKSSKDMYVHADSHENIKYEFALITPAQKKVLLSLPQAFMDDTEEVQRVLLQSLHIAEKPSTLTTYIHASLSMMLHAPRETFDPRSRLTHSRLTLATLLMIASTPRSHSFLSNYLFSCGTQIALPGLLKTYTDNQKCVIRNTRQFLKKDAAIFGASTCFNMVLHKIGLQMPLTNTIASIALAMAPFMLYDYYKYGLLYPIKTQTLAQLIQDHKKTMQIKKASFCTLL